VVTRSAARAEIFQVFVERLDPHRVALRKAQIVLQGGGSGVIALRGGLEISQAELGAVASTVLRRRHAHARVHRRRLVVHAGECDRDAGPDKAVFQPGRGGGAAEPESVEGGWVARAKSSTAD